MNRVKPAHPHKQRQVKTFKITDRFEVSYKILMPFFCHRQRQRKRQTMTSSIEDKADQDCYTVTNVRALHVCLHYGRGRVDVRKEIDK